MDDLRMLMADPVVQTGTAALLGAIGLHLDLGDRPGRHLVGQVAFFHPANGASDGAGHRAL